MRGEKSGRDDNNTPTKADLINRIERSEFKKEVRFFHPDQISICIEQCNDIGKGSWLGVNVARSSFNPFRDENGRPMSIAPEGFIRTPMDRIMLQIDGFTYIDFEVVKNTDQLKIIHNQFKKYEDYPWSEGVSFRDWNDSQIVTWNYLKRRLRKYVILSNERLHPGA